MADSGQDKTEQPTQKRLSDARDKGQVAKSMELNSFAIFTSGLLLIFTFRDTLSNQLGQVAKYVFGSLETFNITTTIVEELAVRGGLLYFVILSPLYIGLVIIALVAGFSQAGLKVSLKAIKPDGKKLDPIKGLKNKIFSTRSLFELLKSLTKLSIIAWVIYMVLSNVILDSTSLVTFSVIEIMSFLIESSEEFLWKIALTFALIAVADFIYQKYKFKKDMMMTKQEIKDENKDSEGSPEVKGKIRGQMMMAARKRMMQELPTADVVVTNPTHFAVALRYKMGQDEAPLVVAKGADALAKKIKEVAKEHNIPIVENPPLARAIFKMCEVNDFIPEKLFKAVAQILAHIYRLKNEKSNKIV
ncbi:MAG: hypothetical protein SCALA702_26890 [Melioribacteraceae bacterium]|nr:MAG: hypothetical protein SCALA702_26890 [Melioribacteraceae bacterium]